jgi:four helix bundle protein
VPIRDFRDLKVWAKSIDLAAEVYRITRQFPADERFGLTLQLRTASVSVSSNIAEGNGRGTKKDYVRFLRISTGSLNEVRSLTILSDRLEFISAGDASALHAMIEEISKMLTGLRKSLSGRKSKR